MFKHLLFTCFIQEPTEVWIQDDQSLLEFQWLSVQNCRIASFFIQFVFYTTGNFFVFPHIHVHVLYLMQYNTCMYDCVYIILTTDIMCYVKFCSLSFSPSTRGQYLYNITTPPQNTEAHQYFRKLYPGIIHDIKVRKSFV